MSALVLSTRGYYLCAERAKKSLPTPRDRIMGGIPEAQPLLADGATRAPEGPSGLKGPEPASLSADVNPVVATRWAVRSATVTLAVTD